MRSSLPSPPTRNSFVKSSVLNDYATIPTRNFGPDVTSSSLSLASSSSLSSSLWRPRPTPSPVDIKELYRQRFCETKTLSSKPSSRSLYSCLLLLLKILLLFLFLFTVFVVVLYVVTVETRFREIAGAIRSGALQSGAVRSGAEKGVADKKSAGMESGDWSDAEKRDSSAKATSLAAKIANENLQNESWQKEEKGIVDKNKKYPSPSLSHRIAALESRVAALASRAERRRHQDAAWRVEVEARVEGAREEEKKRKEDEREEEEEKEELSSRLDALNEELKKIVKKMSKLEKTRRKMKGVREEEEEKEEKEEKEEERRKCPERFVAGPPNSDRCYLFETNRRTWNKAYHYCHAAGAALVTIETKDENDFVKEKIIEIGYALEDFWIGARKNYVNYDHDGDQHGFLHNDWTWVPTGRPVTFNDWGRYSLIPFMTPRTCGILANDFRFGTGVVSRRAAPSGRDAGAANLAPKKEDFWWENRSCLRTQAFVCEMSRD